MESVLNFHLQPRVFEPDYCGELLLYRRGLLHTNSPLAHSVLNRGYNMFNRWWRKSLSLSTAITQALPQFDTNRAQADFRISGARKITLFTYVCSITLVVLLPPRIRVPTAVVVYN